MKKHILLVFVLCSGFLFNLHAACRKDSLYSYEYDNNNKLLTTRIIYSYDNTGLIDETVQLLNNGKWMNINKYIYNNNENGLVDNSIHQEWVFWKQQWKNKRQIDNIYNAQLKKTKEYTSTWDTLQNTWTNIDETTYTFSSKGLDSVFIIRNWKNAQWNNDEKTEFVFDKDTLKYETHYNWIFSEWQPARRVVYKYNNSVLTEKTEQSSQGNQWNDFSRELYTYDNHVIKRKLQQNMNGSTWENSTQTDYTYDGSACLKKIDYLYNWDNNDSIWTYHTQDSFFQVKTVGIHTINTDKLQVYPNPVHSELHIVTPVAAPYRLMDISGRELIAGTLFEGLSAIDIAVFAPGIYMLQSGNHTFKILVE